jgi:hypothetical protein
VLPRGVKIKVCERPGIVFVSEHDTKSRTHTDDTTAILYVPFGTKVRVTQSHGTVKFTS